MADTFYDRIPGQSSTSKYIQVNKTNTDGSYKTDNSVLSGTPSDKIITPNLKSDTQTTVSFVTNPLAKLLGFVSSLIPSKNSTKVSEPAPTDNKAQYGKIQVKESKAGFVTITDDTPGNVRYINLHPSGTYNSMLNNGDYQTKTTGDKQEITDGNWNIITSKDKVEIVVGESKIEIRKNLQSNINGDSNFNTNGVQNSVVYGDVSNDYKSSYNGKISNDYNESVGGNKTEKTSGNLIETINGNHKETISGSLTLTVVGNINIVCGGNAHIMSSGDTNISSNGSINVSSTGICKLESASSVVLSAPSIQLG